MIKDVRGRRADRSARESIGRRDNWKDGEAEPRIEPLSEAAVRITYPDGTSRIVSFDPAIRGDVQIDVEAIRGHAEGRISRR